MLPQTHRRHGGRRVADKPRQNRVSPCSPDTTPRLGRINRTSCAAGREGVEGRANGGGGSSDMPQLPACPTRLQVEQYRPRSRSGEAMMGRKSFPVSKINQESVIRVGPKKCKRGPYHSTPGMPRHRSGPAQGTRPDAHARSGVAYSRAVCGRNDGWLRS